MKFIKGFFAALLMLALSACVSLEAPKTVKQQLAYAVAAHIGAVKSVTQLVTTDVITKAQGRSYRNDLNDIRTTLDAVQLLLETDPAGAETKLAIATKALAIVQKILQDQLKKAKETTAYYIGGDPWPQ